MYLSQNQEQEFIGFSWRKGNKEDIIYITDTDFWENPNHAILKIQFCLKKQISLFIYLKFFQTLILVQLVNNVVIVPVGH